MINDASDTRALRDTGELESLRARALAAARAYPSPTRQQARVRHGVLGLGMLLVPIALFIALGGVRREPRQESLLLWTAGGSLAIAASAVTLAFRRGRSMLGRSRGLLVAVAVLTPIALTIWKLAASSAYPAMMRPWVERPGFRCLGLSCVLSLAPLLGALLLRRGSDPTHPHATGAALGAAVGAGIWVLVDLWCPVGYAPHIALGHLLPVALTVFIGATLGGRVASLRAQRRA
jgi:hypothetical protein